MLNPKHLDDFVNRTMNQLPDSLSARKNYLVTLLVLLPKNYTRRHDVIMVLETLRAHEIHQLKFTNLPEAK